MIELEDKVDKKTIKKFNQQFWVVHREHNQPTLLTDVDEAYTQNDQRKTALRWCKKFRGCIDIGSNVGLWTRELASRFEQVYCFDPNPIFIECFKKNITETNVQLFQYGLSDKEHTAFMIEFNSTIMIKGPGNIKCRTLDSFNLNDIDLIKIDVDGFEVKVLQGAVDTINRNKAVINVEMKKYKRPKTCNKIRKILHRLNYRYMKRTKSDEIWVK